jgi:hypothetical protein
VKEKGICIHFSVIPQPAKIATMVSVELEGKGIKL